MTNYNKYNLLIKMHRDNGPVTASATPISRGNRQNEKFYRTRLCPNGSLCKKIPRCNYAHEFNELKRSVCLSKTRLCNDLKKSGACQRGGKCSFAHSLTELYSTVDMFKTRLCSRPICEELSCRNAHLPSEIFLVKLLLESGELRIEKGRIRHEGYLDILKLTGHKDEVLNSLIREVSIYYQGNKQQLLHNLPTRQDSSASLLAGGLMSRMDSSDLFPANPLRQLSWTFQPSAMASIDSMGHPSTPNLFPQLSARTNGLMSSTTPLYPGLPSHTRQFSLGPDGHVTGAGVGSTNDFWDITQRTFSSDNLVMMNGDRLSSNDFERSGSSRLIRSSLSYKSISPGSSIDLGFGPPSSCPDVHVIGYNNGGACSNNSDVGTQGSTGSGVASPATATFNQAALNQL